jgi:chaperonin cofactor prefoldin
MNLQEIQKQIDTKNGRIDELQLNLKHKDYIGIKIAMGRATKEDYKGDIAKCDEWAGEIDRLRNEVNELVDQKDALQKELDDMPHEM